MSAQKNLPRSKEDAQIEKNEQKAAVIRWWTGMTNDERNALCSEWNDLPDNVQSDICIYFMKTVETLAYKMCFYKSELILEEVKSAGLDAMLEAVRTFDPTKKTRIETWVYYIITKRILTLFTKKKKQFTLSSGNSCSGKEEHSVRTYKILKHELCDATPAELDEFKKKVITPHDAERFEVENAFCHHEMDTDEWADPSEPADINPEPERQGGASGSDSKLRPSEPVDTNPNPEQRAILNEDMKLLEECINKVLTQAQKKIVAYKMQGYGNQDLAKIYNIPEQTVKNRYFQSIKKLTECVLEKKANVTRRNTQTKP